MRKEYIEDEIQEEVEEIPDRVVEMNEEKKKKAH